MKVGDILYARKKEHWHDTLDDSKGGKWHDVQMFESFKIKRIFQHRYSKRVELTNSNNTYQIVMTLQNLEDAFLSEQEYRKLKLSQIEGGLY